MTPPRKNAPPPGKAAGRTDGRRGKGGPNNLPTDPAKLAAGGAAGGRASFALNEEVLAQILSYISTGAYYTVAARACGFSDATVRKWRLRGEAVYVKLCQDYGQDQADEINPNEDQSGNVAECPYTTEELHPNEWMCFRLWHGLNKAEAAAEVAAVAHVRAAWGDSWQAAMTFLERKHPERWKRRDLHEVAALQAAEDKQDEDHMLSPAAQQAIENAMLAELEAGDTAPPAVDAEGFAVEDPHGGLS